VKRLLLGPRAVTEALRAAPKRIAVVYALGSHGKAIDEVTALASRCSVRVETREREALDALARGARHQGVVAIGGDYSYLPLEQILNGAAARPLLVALDQISDPHNLGAIVRSAVAMGADGVVTLRDRAAPVTSAAVRVSAGATEAARIARVTNLARTLASLRAQGMQVVGLAAEGEAELHELPYPDAGRVLVVGSEGRGLRRLVREQCERLARIALPGPLASLNASVAAGIAIHESARMR
jgi:23S rRNA (guanosine2251-2'-O)-methyltransferase